MSFYDFLAGIGSVTGDEYDYDYAVRTQLPASAVLRAFEESVTREPYSPDECAFTPGARAVVETPTGTLCFAVEGWSSTCSSDRDLPRNVRRLMRAFRREMAAAGGVEVAAEDLTVNRVSYLVWRQP